jgi:hypothetical protein
LFALRVSVLTGAGTQLIRFGEKFRYSAIIPKRPPVPQFGGVQQDTRPTNRAGRHSWEILEIGGPSGTHDAPIVDKVMPRTAMLNKAKFGRRRFAT